MSDTNNQQPANEDQPQGKQQPPKTGGLFSNYQQKPSKAGGLLSGYKSQGNPNSMVPPGSPSSFAPQSQPGQFGPGTMNPSQSKGTSSQQSFPGNPPSSWGGPAQPQSPQVPFPEQPPIFGQPGQPGGQPFANAMQQLRGFTSKMAAIRARPAQPQGPQAPYAGQPPMSGQPGQAGGQPPIPGQPGQPGGQPFANAVQQLRGFTSKMAAITGHTVQPPAPPMERYRPSSSNMGMGMNGGGGGGGGMPPSGPRMPSEGPHKRSLPLKIAMQKRQRRLKSKGPTRAIMIALVALLILVVSTASGGTAYGYSFYQQQLPKVQQYANQQIPQMTRIYDRNGVLLYQAYTNDPAIGGRRVDVTYQDIPQIMQDAMTSTEDKTFWTNSGFDPTSIVRAASSGNGGASTITQQLIKNLSGDNQLTLQRKINEVAMSIGLTQQFPKSTILTMYLNTVPFGSQDYGVEVAAEDYFGLQPICKTDQRCVPAISLLNYNQQTKKDDPILGLARASLLAGIPNAPYTYDPTLDATHKQAALNRQDYVLQQMKANNIKVGGQPITNKMIQEAEAMTAKMTFTLAQNTKRAPSFVDYVIKQMETALGNGNIDAGVEPFVTGGYNIRTTIDANLDDYAQASIQRHLYQPEYQKGPQSSCPPIILANDDNGYCNGKGLPANVKNGAVVVQDVKNGEILAMVGSANYNSTSPQVEGQVNVADSPRQPGSTFKLFDYSTAFEMGWNPGITLADTMTAFPNDGRDGGSGTAGTPVPPTPDEAMNNPGNYPGVYDPSDYGGTWWNYMESITWATANSMNVPAIRAMQYTGQQAVEEMAERLGVTFLPQQGFGFPAAIGADDISPLQMVNAYATFGNGGVKETQTTILDIWNNYGQSLYHFNENNPQGTRVVSPQVAYEMTKVLTNEPARDFEFDGDQDLALSDIDPTCETVAITDSCSYQLAAKTGTTDNFTDNWTIGYTPEVAVAVWVGNDDSSALKNSIGITGAAPIFHSVIERTLGFCNDSTATQKNPDSPYAINEVDNIPCGAGGSYKFPFSGHPQLQFTNPGGVVFGIQSGLTPTGKSSNGNGQGVNDPLPAYGSAEPDWMLSGN